MIIFVKRIKKLTVTKLDRNALIAEAKAIREELKQMALEAFAPQFAVQRLYA